MKCIDQIPPPPSAMAAVATQNTTFPAAAAASAAPLNVAAAPDGGAYVTYIAMAAATHAFRVARLSAKGDTLGDWSLPGLPALSGAGTCTLDRPDPRRGGLVAAVSRRGSPGHRRHN